MVLSLDYGHLQRLNERSRVRFIPLGNLLNAHGE